MILLCILLFSQSKYDASTVSNNELSQRLLTKDDHFKTIVRLPNKVERELHYNST